MRPTRLAFLGTVAVVLLLVALASCGGGEDAAEAGGDGAPTQISVLYNERASAPYREDWLVVQEYLSRRGVALAVTTGDDADYETAVHRVFASAVVPDIVLKVWPETVQSYAVGGELLSVGDYEDRLPEYQAFIDRHNLAAEIDRLRIDDGRYFVFPGYQRPIQVQQWVYRRDLFERHDIPVPATFDEMLDALVVLKEEYPESTSITADWGGAHLFAMLGAAFGTSAGWNGAQHYDFDSDSWEYAPITEEYRAMIRFLHRCHEAGVLDGALFSQTGEDFAAKITDGRAFVTPTWISAGLSLWNEGLEANGVAGGEWAPMAVPETSTGVRALPPVDRFRKGLVVPSSVAHELHFDALLSFLDWAVYSDEGITLTTWGVEGITFATSPQGKYLLPSIRWARNPDGTLDLTADFGCNTLFNLNEDPTFEDYRRPPEIAEFLRESIARGDVAPMPPELVLDPIAIDAIAAIEAPVGAYASEALRGFITGELSVDRDWDWYVAELVARGANTIERIWNAEWNE